MYDLVTATYNGEIHLNSGNADWTPTTECGREIPRTALFAWIEVSPADIPLDLCPTCMDSASVFREEK